MILRVFIIIYLGLMRYNIFIYIYIYIYIYSVLNKILILNVFYIDNINFEIVVSL